MAITPITIPKWGIEMQEATFSEWRVAPGDTVEQGDEIADLETDKIVNVAEAPGSGVLRRQIAEVGEVYPVGVLIGVIADDEVSDAEIDAFVASFVPVDASFDGDEGVAAELTQAERPPPPPASGGARRISPIARRLAEKLGVDWSGINGTGNNGRISKQDIEAAARQMSTVSPSIAAPAKRSGLQRTVAKRMTEAKQQIPHFYLRIEANLDRALALREQYNETNNTGVTINDLLLAAVARALQDSPTLNVQYRDDDVFALEGTDIGVAIASSHGLVAPLLRDVGNLSIQAISNGVRVLSDAAEKRELQAQHFDGGAITVSNLGGYGVSDFVAIINPPQTSILAVGRASKKAVVINDEPAVATSLTLNLSCDHRAFDGAAGARFLDRLRLALEEPDDLFR